MFRLHDSRCMADAEEPCESAALGFVGIDGESGIAASPGMSHVIGATANAAVVPGIHDVENEWCVDTNRRVQATGRLPRPISDAGHIFAIDAGRVERDDSPTN